MAEEYITAISRTPNNLNYLSQLNFKFQLMRAPHVEFFIQQVNIPRIHLPSPESENPFVKIPYPGDHIEYGDLVVDFKIDESLESYLEIHNWIRALGFPEKWEEYAEISKNPTYSGKGIYSDITVSILSNLKTMNFDVTYIDAYPVDLSEIVLRTTDNDVQYLTATAVFKYTYYNIGRTI